MMRIILIVTLSTLHICWSIAYGQSFSMDPLPIQALDIAFNKTTSLRFPYPIQSVDRGSPEVLVKKLEGVDNILLVKAVRKGFSPTNLSVITQGGRMFAFMLHYKDQPSALNLNILGDAPGSAALEAGVQLTEVGDRKAALSRQAERVLHKLPACMHRVRNSGLRFSMLGLYTEGNCLYLKLRIENRRPVPLELHPLRIAKRSTRRMKRSGVQEIDLKPLLVFPPITRLAPESQREVVIALNAFSLDSSQRLRITLSGSDIPPMSLKLSRRHFSRIEKLRP